MKDPALVERIAAAEPDRAAILRAFPSEVVEVATPFYRSTRVVDLEVATEVGPIRYRYGLHGDAVFRLGERPEEVQALNDSECLCLTRDGVPPYVRFFFDSVAGRRMRIVERGSEIRWRHRGAEGLVAQTPRPAPRPVSAEPLGTGFRAVANATWNATLVELEMEVSATGQVRPTGHRMVEQHLDVIPD